MEPAGVLALVDKTLDALDALDSAGSAGSSDAAALLPPLGITAGEVIVALGETALAAAELTSFSGAAVIAAGAATVVDICVSLMVAISIDLVVGSYAG